MQMANRILPRAARLNGGWRIRARYGTLYTGYTIT